MGLFKVFNCGGKVHRSIALLVVFVAIVAILPVATATQAFAGGMTLSSDYWSRDPITGLVSYSLRLSAYGTNDPGGPCVGSCKWRIDAYYLNGSTDVLVKQGLHAGEGSRPSFERTVTASGSSLADITHVRAVLYPNYNTNTPYDTGLVAVADPTEGGLALSPIRWDRDLVTGLLTYEVELKAWGTGAYGGPCVGSCTWRIDAHYINGSTSVLVKQGWLTESPPTGWGFTRSLGGSEVSLEDVTHLRAYLYPNYNSNLPYDSGLVAVAAPSPGGIKLKRQQWERDSASGGVTYDLELSVWNAGSHGGPCVGSCYWAIQAGNPDDPNSTVDLNSGSGSDWTWSRRITAVGKTIPAGVTHVRAVVTANYADGIYETGWIFVGDHVIEDQDLIPFELALAGALAASPGSFCEVLLTSGGSLGSADGNSLPDAYERCEGVAAGVNPTIRRLLAAVATATGAQLAYDLLIDEHVNDGPIPTPEEEQNPPLPWLPPEDWQDNGCHQAITSIEGATAKIENNHVWGADQGKSEFYSWVAWRGLAKYDAPKVMAEPSLWSGSQYCVRRVTYSRPVGVERYRNEVVGPTATYTVLTHRDSGALFNMYPGEPAERQGV